MKKSQLAEVLENEGYHVNEGSHSMVLWMHGDYVGHISKKYGSESYIPNYRLPAKVIKLVTKYGDM